MHRLNIGTVVGIMEASQTIDKLAGDMKSLDKTINDPEARLTLIKSVMALKSHTTYLGFVEFSLVAEEK